MEHEKTITLPKDDLEAPALSIRKQVAQGTKKSAVIYQTFFINISEGVLKGSQGIG